ncbi:hypothetical protein ACS5NO_12595 [Larkinella sp. GY13]|uniref:hypothetical protein n=1 Tax=Larkinella sp. GY13 TaxID=3453720 RepID=UPI003EECBACE
MSKGIIQERLTQLGFKIDPKQESTHILADLEVKYEGQFFLKIDLRIQTINFSFSERFGEKSLLYLQTFTDVDHLVELIKGNYIFDEMVTTRTPDSTRLLDVVLPIQAEWYRRDLGDIEPLLNWIRTGASHLFAGEIPDSKPQSLGLHCQNLDKPGVEQTE